MAGALERKPSFKGVDEAIRRRVLLVPFLPVIPEAERDEHLPDKLKAEWSAILRWAIDGCLAWQREGLAPPQSAKAATKDYLDAEDVLGQWLEERCIVSPKVGWTALKNLYDNWRSWAEPRGLQVARLVRDPRHLDSITDIAGYAGCLAEVLSDA